MRITVGGIYSTSNPFDALKYYHCHLLRGDPFIPTHAWIEFGSLTLHRLNEDDGYVVYGINPKSPQVTMVQDFSRVLNVNARSAADTDFALMRFTEDGKIQILTINLPAQERLGIPKHSFTLTKWSGMIDVFTPDAPTEKPEGLT